MISPPSVPMSRERTGNACREVYALLRACPDLTHVAAYDGYLVCYVDGDCGPPWAPVMSRGGLPVYCHRSGSIHGARPA